MIIIVVDVGNTKTKLALFSGNELVKTYAVVTKHATTTLHKLIKKHTPKYSVLSNVGAALPELKSILKTSTKPLFVASNTSVPINLEYRSKTLGTDRLAIAVFAHHLFRNQNALVVSAGTCITYDVVDKKGNYLGGGISPGLNMRLQSMHEYTSRLPKVKLRQPVDTIGNTTESSLLSGAILGAAHEVNGFISQYRQEYPGLKVILTGGDAPYLEPRLKFKIFARPNAVLEGLHCILQHNLGAL